MLGYGLVGTVIVVLLIVYLMRGLWTHSSGVRSSTQGPGPRI